MKNIGTFFKKERLCVFFVDKYCVGPNVCTTNCFVLSKTISVSELVTRMCSLFKLDLSVFYLDDKKSSDSIVTVLKPWLSH